MNGKMIADKLRKCEKYESIGLEPEEVKTNEEMFKAYRHVCGGKSPEEIKEALENNLPFMGYVQRNIFDLVLIERYRQDNKWGEQNHVMERWATILGEEYGELCEVINETIFVDGTHGGYENMKKEAIQVAAVAIAFIEQLERNKEKLGEINGTPGS